jgi:cytoskeleton protein RodZ
MTSVGDVLRGAREQQGRTIAEVSEDLCLTKTYVRAMESGDLNELPGLFFYKSFVRQYAALLGVDQSLIAPALAELAPNEVTAASQNDAKPTPLFPLDPIGEYTNRFYFSEHRMGWSVVGLIAALALSSGIYAWWSGAPRVTDPIAAVAPSSPTDTVGSADTAAAAQQVSVSRDQDADSPEEEAHANGDQQVVLSLSATERTWLRITSDGRTIFSGILQPSESKVLKGSDMATMKVGNAAGIDVRLNGRPIGPLGPRGQVRTVRFTSEDFEILTPGESGQAAADPKTL